MASNGVDLVQEHGAWRVRLPPFLANMLDSEPDPDHIISRQMSGFQLLRSRLLFFLGFCALLISFVWLCVCLVLYPLGTEYQIMNLMFESRWLLCTILFTGLSAILLAVFRFETLYLFCGVSTVYNCGSCCITVLVYSLNFYRARYQKFQIPLSDHPPSKQPRHKYLQLCGCMIVLALMAFLLGFFVLCKLKRLAQVYYPPYSLQKYQKRYLRVSALVQVPFVLYSIYVAAHVMVLKVSYIQQYMIQEIFCSLVLLTSIIIQLANAHKGQTDRMSLKLLLSLNLCQTVQEIFYTWNSYYVAIYIHTSSKSNLADADARGGQILLGVNFVGHLLRLCLGAYSSFRIVLWVEAPLARTKFQNFELSSGVRKVLLGLSVSALALAVLHLVMDIVYTLSAHIYRTIIAFTGISVFYLGLIGICLGFFLKTNRIILLIVTFVLCLLSGAVSGHALYIYLDMSFRTALLRHLEELGKDIRQPSYMHFVEGYSALLVLVLCLVTSLLIFRLLHIESIHDRRDGALKRPLLILFFLGIFQFALTSANSVVLLCIKDEGGAFHALLAYGVLDTLSTLVLCLTQIYFTRPSNTHLHYGLTALLFFLICEILTTFNYLSTKTSYIQVLLVFQQIFTKNKFLPKHLFANLFLAKEVALMISSHAIQLFQWFLAVATTVLTAIALEILYRQRRELRASLPISATEVSLATSIASIQSVALPVACTSAASIERHERNENAAGVSDRNQNSFDNPNYKVVVRKNHRIDAVALLGSGCANDSLSKDGAESRQD